MYLFLIFALKYRFGIMDETYNPYIKKHMKGVKYQYYEINIEERRLYLNIKVDRIKKEIRLNSITTGLKNANLNE